MAVSSQSMIVQSDRVYNGQKELWMMAGEQKDCFASALECPRSSGEWGFSLFILENVRRLFFERPYRYFIKNIILGIVAAHVISLSQGSKWWHRRQKFGSSRGMLGRKYSGTSEIAVIRSRCGFWRCTGDPWKGSNDIWKDISFKF